MDKLLSELMANIGIDLSSMPDSTVAWRFNTDGTVELITADEMYKE